MTIRGFLVVAPPRYDNIKLHLSLRGAQQLSAEALAKAEATQ
jgi:hypothetical protein